MLLAVFTVWIARHLGPRKGETFLRWLSLSLLVVAIPVLIDRLVALYGQARVLPVLGLLAVAGFVALFVSRARKARREVP